jgi:hypothetical protein
MSQAIEGGVRQLRPRRITVGEVGYEPAFEGWPSGPADRMRASVAALDRAIADSDRPGALLLYDESHILADDRPRERFPLSGFLAAVASVQRELARVRVILSGLPTLSLNLKRARTYAERMFRHVVVGNLERGDAWDALGIPLAGSGRSFALSLIGDIVETTGGYPYFLQFVGDYLCRSITTPDVTAADYQAVEPALLHELDLAFFEDRFEGASPTEQRILEAMAREPGQIRLTRLRPHVGDVPSVDLVVRRLVERGLIHRTAPHAAPTTSPCRCSAPTSGVGRGIFRMFHDPKDWRPHPVHPWPGRRADEEAAGPSRARAPGAGRRVQPACSLRPSADDGESTGDLRELVRAAGRSGQEAPPC